MWLGGKNFGAIKKSTETKLNEVTEVENSRYKATGLNTGLNPTFVNKTAKNGSDNLGGFLTAVKKNQLLRFERPNSKTSEIYDVLQRLKKSGCVCVPKDKTNSTRVIKIEDYKRWVSD